MKSIVTGETYQGLSINTGMNHDLGCYEAILKKYQALLKYMLTHHSKVLQIRFDLRYPSDYPFATDKQLVSNFAYNMKRKLSRMNISGHLLDPQYLWVKEQNGSEHPHFHFILLVNGNAVQNYWLLLKNIIEPLWLQTIGQNIPGLIDYCDGISNGLLIDRNSPNLFQVLNDCSYQASYLSKTSSKDQREKGSWLCSSSRVVSSPSSSLDSYFGTFR